MDGVIATYLGPFALGSWVPLELFATMPDGQLAVPLVEPTATILDASSATVATITLPRSPGPAGRYGRQMIVGRAFSRGRYRVLYRYQVPGPVQRYAVDLFEVVGGGDPEGAIISLREFRRPEARYVVGQTASGRLVQGRNPRV